MASLKTDSIENKSDKAFETEMLLAHAETTFIENLRTLKNTDLLKPENEILQSLVNDISILRDRNSNLLTEPNKNLDDMTPYNFIHVLGQHLNPIYTGIADDIHIERVDLEGKYASQISEIKKYNAIRKENEQWGKEERVKIYDNILLQLREKIQFVIDRDRVLFSKKQQIDQIINRLGLLETFLYSAQRDHDAKVAELSLVADVANLSQDLKKKELATKKKKAKKKAKTARKNARKAQNTDPMPYTESIKDTQPVEYTEPVKESEPVEEMKTIEVNEIDPKDAAEANILIDKIVELFSYLKEKGIYAEERKKRKATFERAAALQERLKKYFKQTFIPLLKENNLNFIITGGYATRLLSNGNYMTDDIDIKIFPREQIKDVTIEKIRDETVKLLNENPPDGLNAFFKFFDRAKNLEEKKKWRYSI